jgi:ubiquinone/menaquinone biosynthesis C-methylase UbiE
MMDKTKEKPHGAGRSSFELVDGAKLFAALRLGPGSSFLDLGCGPGHYALAAAPALGKTGLIYAIDLWEEGIAYLRQQASAQGLNHLRAMVGDFTQRLPLGDKSVDVCLMATVLHDLVEIKAADRTLREVCRVLKKPGRLAIVEFKKISGPPGPPLSIRLAPEEVENLVNPFGFRKDRVINVGPYNYLIIFGIG